MFDVYIAVDFSGSHNHRRQRQSIAYAEITREKPVHVEQNLTRPAVVTHVMNRLHFYNGNGRRVLFGFDFQYSFPYGFWSHITGGNNNWVNIVNGLKNGVQELNNALPSIKETPQSNARAWAAAVNNLFPNDHGPFWGPNFVEQLHNPGFNFSEFPFKQYRLIEKLHLSEGFKSIFQIGGAGTVGLQSLCGMPHLHRIRQFCHVKRMLLHCWPFDGIEIDEKGEAHILVEWYPTLHNHGVRNDVNDATACVEWAKGRDEDHTLIDFFHLNLNPDEIAIVQSEGWVLGLPAHKKNNNVGNLGNMHEST